MNSDQTESATDPFALRKLYQPLRVVDVCDAMDGIGYFDIGLMDPDVRPLWPGMKFWGVALTIRCVPASRPMWKLETTEDIVNAHGIWFKEVGHVGTGGLVKPGHVIVTDTGGAREVGFWGSANSLGAMADGAVGIVTDGYCRDTCEVALQKTPICARKRGRTIIPGRIEVVETQVRVGCGGVQVAPGDMVGCGDGGVDRTIQHLRRPARHRMRPSQYARHPSHVLLRTEHVVCRSEQLVGGATQTARRARQTAGRRSQIVRRPTQTARRPSRVARGVCEHSAAGRRQVEW